MDIFRGRATMTVVRVCSSRWTSVHVVGVERTEAENDAQAGDEVQYAAYSFDQRYVSAASTAARSRTIFLVNSISSGSPLACAAANQGPNAALSRFRTSWVNATIRP